MNNRIKIKTIIVGMIVAMSLQLSGCSGNTKHINVGDYVQFGKYYDEPILWKCFNKDNGVMLVSEHILCLKAFDAAESGKSDTEGGSYTTDKSRQRMGSNNWSNSNIREWLNSTEDMVKFTTQAPIKEAISNGYNSYAQEPGFLTNFKSSEQKKIKTVSHDGVSDKVYLLSEDEVNKYFGKMESGKNIREITISGKRNSDFKFEQNIWSYLTRTPGSERSDLIRTVTYIGIIQSVSSYSGDSGILPALNLKSDIAKSGKGTVDDPWQVI